MVNRTIRRKSTISTASSWWIERRKILASITKPEPYRSKTRVKKAKVGKIKIKKAVKAKKTTKVKRVLKAKKTTRIKKAIKAKRATKAKKVSRVKKTKRV